ncbi:hypothetical protein FNJ88_11310 [Chryseobacterium sp. SNU WT5]|uniref:hypothetical protein n=1 Tax=Chryseobacterium sp. SNU WT5 TaxID=2594269 RepID=UPI00117E9C2D|nr:hypothetical protein [Chryseobacterium sp. SNU WT5]QDP86107.1 hypothetical protein FNJ88_11310 [Chryseobacterium sp. SNU WT5]
MKKLTTLFLTLLAFSLSAQNFELSTLRIGEYKIFMKKTEAQKLAQKQFPKFTDYENKSKVDYYGEIIELAGQTTYISEAETEVEAIQYLGTKSKKFRTKSGMGVGSTKDELLTAYNNYRNFSMNQSWAEDEKTTSYFTLSDHDAGTELTFRIVNNVVAEVTIYINEGC